MIPLAAALAAQPRPRAPEEKIMNEMDAVLALPRPPCPGNLSAGAGPARTPRAESGRGGSRDLGQELRVCDEAPLGPWAPVELPACQPR